MVIFKYDVTAFDFTTQNIIYVNPEKKKEYTKIGEQNKFMIKYPMVCGNINATHKCCNMSKIDLHMCKIKNYKKNNTLWYTGFCINATHKLSNILKKDCIHKCPKSCSKKIIITVEFEEIVRKDKAVLKNIQIVITYKIKSLLDLYVLFIKENEKLLEKIKYLNKDIRKYFD